MNYVPLILAATALILTACNQAETAPAPQPAPTTTEAPPTLATVEETVSFTCENDLPVTAVYGTNAEGVADVALVVEGLTVELVHDGSAAKRYTTVKGWDGLEAGRGLIWEDKGEQGLLYDGPSDHIDDPSQIKLQRTCNRQ